MLEKFVFKAETTGRRVTFIKIEERTMRYSSRNRPGMDNASYAANSLFAISAVLLHPAPINFEELKHGKEMLFELSLQSR